MVKRHLVRGYNEEVYFAEKSGNAEKLYKLALHSIKPGLVTKKEIYQLAGSNIVAFETDCENIQDDSEPGEHVKQSFYIMDDNQKIHRIVDEDGIKFIDEITIDFSMHNSLREVSKLRQQDWSHVHISARSLTFDGDTYSL